MIIIENTDSLGYPLKSFVDRNAMVLNANDN